MLQWLSSWSSPCSFGHCELPVSGSGQLRPRARLPLIGGVAAAVVMLLARATLENDYAVLLLGGLGAAGLYAAIVLRGELTRWREQRDPRRKSLPTKDAT